MRATQYINIKNHGTNNYCIGIGFQLFDGCHLKMAWNFKIKQA